MDTKSKVRRHYCTVCSNYRGKDVNGRTVSLHRFPMHEKIRSAWIRRIKLVKKGYRYNDTQRLCSEHFIDGRFIKNAVPSVFGDKVFNSSTVDGIGSCDTDDTEQSGNIPDQEMEEEYAEVQETLCTDSSFEVSSLFLHDYCGQIGNSDVSSVLDKAEQTDLTYSRSMTIETQTDKKETCSLSTQTEFCSESTVKYTQRPKVFVDAEIQCNRPVFTYESIKTDQKFMFYTGIPNKQVFESLFDEMDEAYQQTTRSESNKIQKKGRPRSLRLIDEFFLVLMRLRLGLLLEDIADRFNIAKSTCGGICDKWISYLHVKLSFLTVWPSQAMIKKHMPKKFKSKYPSCRVIIDCTELFTETPQSLSNKSLLFSNYKSHMTYKALIGITPSGYISFASDLWSGSISDKQITQRCGIIELCESGDAIMADKGFLISDLTTPRGVGLIIPPFKTKRFSRREIEETRRIANLRIDVERAIERVKNFRILRGDIPITLAHCASKLWHICVHLSNLQPPLIQDAPGS